MDERDIESALLTKLQELVPDYLKLVDSFSGGLAEAVDRLVAYAPALLLKFASRKETLVNRGAQLYLCEPVFILIFCVSAIQGSADAKDSALLLAEKIAEKILGSDLDLEIEPFSSDGIELIEAKEDKEFWGLNLSAKFILKKELSE